MIPISDYDLGTARGRIELDASSLGRASAAFLTLGGAMVGFGALLTGGFALAVSKAADFEKTMSAVKAVTNGTNEQMDKLGELALTTASKSAFGAKEIAGAFEDLGKAGISVEDIMGGAAEAAVRLAEAAGSELPGGIGQGAEIMANALKTFEVGADQAMHFADVLVAAAASSTLSVDDIATSMRYAGPVANQLGFSIDDLATTLAILGDRGIKGSTAGTSLRGVLLSLTPSSAKAASAMKDLGLITEDGTNRFYDMNGAMKPMPEVMQILGDATKNLSEQEKIAAFNAIFQRRAMNAALILAEQGAGGFNEYADAIAGLNAADIAATKLDNLSGDITIMKNAVDALLIRAGKPFQDMLRGWVQGLTGVIQWITNLNPKTLEMAVRVAAIAGAIFIALGAIALFIGIAIKMYASFVVLKEAIMLVSGAMKLLASSLLLNPWFLLAAAIVAIGVALYSAYQQGGAFTEWWDAFFQTAIAPAIALLQSFATTAINAWNSMLNGRSVLEFLRDILLQIGTFIQTNVLPVLVALGQWFMATAVPAIQAFAAVIQHAFGVVIATVVPWALGLFQEMVTWFQTMLPQIIEAVTHVFNAVSTVITTVMNVIMAVVTQVINVISALWRAWGDDLINMVGTVWAFIRTTIESAIKIIQGVIQTVLALINGDWGKAWDGIKQILAGAWDFMVGAVKAAVGLVKGIFTGFVSTLIEIWNGLWEKLKGLLSAAWEAMKSTTTTAIGALVGFFVGLPGKILGAIGDLAGSIFNFFNSGFQKMINAAMDKAAALITYVTGIPGRILSALGDLGRLLLNAGKALMDGLLQGIKDGFNAVKNYVGGIAGTIASLKGPLPYDRKVLIENGEALMAGLAAGLMRGFSEVESYLRDVTASIPLTMDVNGTAKVIGAAATTLPAAAGTTITVGKVEIPARDLEEMRTVQDFFDRIQQVARQGVGV